MGSEKLPAVVNHNHSQEVKRPYHEANLIDTTFYTTKIDNSSCCMYISYNKFIKEPKCMNVFCDKEVCVPIIPSQKIKSCRNHWKLKTAMIYMFFTSVCKLWTTTVAS